MFNRLIALAVRFRWPVVFLSALIAAYGLFQLSQLPIDAVPDITNRQVQINTILYLKGCVCIAYCLRQESYWTEIAFDPSGRLLLIQIKKTALEERFFL